MNKVVQILMLRDELTEEEALDMFNECKEEIEQAVEEGDYELAEEILESDLGLEMDYIFDILY